MTITREHFRDANHPRRHGFATTAADPAGAALPPAAPATGSQYRVAPAAAVVLVVLVLIAAVAAAAKALVEPVTALVVVHFGG